jgi:hypothetical protein
MAEKRDPGKPLQHIRGDFDEWSKSGYVIHGNIKNLTAPNNVVYGNVVNLSSSGNIIYGHVTGILSASGNTIYGSCNDCTKPGNVIWGECYRHAIYSGNLIHNDPAYYFNSVKTVPKAEPGSTLSKKRANPSDDESESSSSSEDSEKSKKQKEDDSSDDDDDISDAMEKIDHEIKSKKEFDKPKAKVDEQKKIKEDEDLQKALELSITESKQTEENFKKQVDTVILKTRPTEKAKDRTFECPLCLENQVNTCLRCGHFICSKCLDIHQGMPCGFCQTPMNPDLANPMFLNLEAKPLDPKK